ncbi:filamentous hemagglutinin N-terminal domain-containing protein [Acinetobacter terrestris]|uniref:two-partner secretion domain-containing protein n=1 Tax=Acinetobacter terrestris TaxID=2529843 RepID=UPI00103D1EC9|nr:filamentous hemagglutinin N-terminal domain-containing protein [Acinetobacter terrestris]TCB50290.1 filamentous hemagglutinin N-terminal domain-containing protein [Acinetobacter terrestris]
MNRFYRVVWNNKMHCWQAVSELAKRHSGNGTVSDTNKNMIKVRMCCALSTVLLTLSSSIFAAINETTLPTGQQVMSGSADFTQTGNTLNINQHTQNLSTHWNTFNIGRHATVNFNQQNQSSVALNRVLDNNASQIMGRLNANGQVFLINPNGVIFSKTAQVNVGGIVASTLDLQEYDLLQGKFTFAGRGENGAVENYGDIQVANSGTVALIAPVVKNTGSITAPNGQVKLTAADKVRVSLQNGKLASYDIDKGTLQGLVENGGAIIADNGVVHLTAVAEKQLGRAVVNHTGYIQANRLETNAKGEIVLLGDISKGAVNISGSLVAEGKNGQNGGFIETSAASVNIADLAQVSTKAGKNGKTGTWLIDPVDFVVAAKNGNMTGAALNAALKNTDVTIQTTETQTTVSNNSSLTQNNSTGKGDILVNDAIQWDSGKTLTLDAYNNIYINNVVDASQGNGGKLVLKYGQQSADGSNGSVYSAINNQNMPTYADYFIQAPVHLQQGLNFSKQRGSDVANLKEFQVITDVTALQAIKDDLVGNYALGTNLDAGSIANFTPIGTMIEGSGPNAGNSPFTGLFDGLGHVIENLKIDKQGYQGQGSYVGLFGKIEDADIRNVGLINAQIQGSDSVGGLIGSMANSKLSNSFVQGSVTGDFNAGALVGASYYSTVDGVYSTAQVNSENGPSVLIGDNWGSSISNGYFTQADGDITVWNDAGAESTLTNSQAKSKQNYLDLGWNISDMAGSGTAWRIYEGQTGPLLRAFLTPLAVKADDYHTVYNGSNQNSSSYANSVQNADTSKIRGNAVYEGGGKNAGIHKSQLSGLYSVQNGYDLAFEAADVKIDKAIISNIAGISANNKTYDGTNLAILNTANAVFDGLLQGDQLGVIGQGMFSNAAVGNNKQVNIQNLVLTGDAAQNYQLANLQLTAQANITAASSANISDLATVHSTPNMNNIGAISPINLSGMDLESALMAVQSQRANLLESQLRDQISGVQARNEQIGKLNTTLNSLQALLAIFSSPNQKSIQLTAGSNIDKLFQKLKVDAQAAGVDIGSLLKGNILNKADIEALQTGIKGQIDSASNSQQMDMLRLQGLSNKRNEAFDTMTNFIKKMQDSRSSIIGTMRNVAQPPVVPVMSNNGNSSVPAAASVALPASILPSASTGGTQSLPLPLDTSNTNNSNNPAVPAGIASNTGSSNNSANRPKTSADFSELKDLDAATKAKFDALIAAGFLDGSGGSLGANGEMNRAQFAKVAALIWGLEDRNSSNPSGFQDVPTDGYALPYIEAIKKAGLIDGNGAFSPSGNITTEQLATLLVKKLSDSNSGLASADASKPSSSGINSSDREQLKKLLKQINSSNNLPSAPSSAIAAPASAPSSGTAAPASPAAPLQDSGNSSGTVSSTNGGSSALGTNQSAVIQQLYIAYFGRPADEAGLAYWTTQLSSGAISQSDIINAFTNAAQNSGNSSGAASSTNSGSSALGTNQSEIIDQIYQSLFARSPDEAGLAYWVTQLSSNGSTTSLQLVTDILSRVDGNNNGTFNPSEKITKEQLATLMVKLPNSNSVPNSTTDLASPDALKPSSSDIEQLKKLLNQMNSSSDGSAASNQAALEKLKQVTPAK